MKKINISEIDFASQPWFKNALRQSVQDNVIKNSGAYITAITYTDLNELLEYGEYLMAGSAPNTPTSEQGVLVVRSYGNTTIGRRIVQTYYTTEGSVFSRFKYVGREFTAWREL